MLKRNDKKCLSWKNCEIKKVYTDIFENVEQVFLKKKSGETQRGETLREVESEGKCATDEAR